MHDYSYSLFVGFSPESQLSLTLRSLLRYARPLLCPSTSGGESISTISLSFSIFIPALCWCCVVLFIIVVLLESQSKNKERSNNVTNSAGPHHKRFYPADSNRRNSLIIIRQTTPAWSSSFCCFLFN